MFVLSYREHLEKGYFFLIWFKEKHLCLTYSTPVVAIDAPSKTPFKTKAMILIKQNFTEESVARLK